MARILVSGDSHIPFVRSGYLQFLKDLRKEYRCDIILHIGDVTDSHSISFHEHHPELPNSLDEHKLTLATLKEWETTFPKMKICIGNHDVRYIRLANSVNIPSQFLKTYQEIWGTKNWNWQWSFDIDNIHFVHGHNSGGGLWPAYNMMRKTAQSCVCGHYHSAAGLKYLANHNARLFGLDVGAGCDDNQLAFAYNQFNAIRSVMSAAVILDGVPYLEIMPISKDEKYFDKKEKS